MDKPTGVRTMILVRRIVLTLVAALVVLVGATTAEAANPVIAAVKRTADARSSVFDMQMTVEAAGQSVAINGSGSMRGQDSAKMTMRTSGGGANVAFDMLMLRESGRLVMYMRSPAFRAALPAGKTWMRLDLDLAAAKLGLDYSELIETSRTLGPLEHGLVSTKRVGTDVVAGMETTRYKAVIDTKRAARAVPAFAKQLRAIERQGVRVPRLTEDVWVGRDGRIRRVGLSFPFAQQGVRATSSLTMTFRAYDVPVTIAAPPRAQVFDFS
jgi:HAMP domain-containing protein